MTTCTAAKHSHSSFSFIVHTLFMGRVRIVTPEGEVFVSKGYPDVDKVLEYLDKGFSPKGSSKWSYAGKANHEDLVMLADRQAVLGAPRLRGCERCDGEGDHFEGEPCTAW